MRFLRKPVDCGGLFGGLRDSNSDQIPKFLVVAGGFIEISIKWKILVFHFWELLHTLFLMIIIGTDVVENYFKAHVGHRGIKAARAQYDAWRAIAEAAYWKTPEDVKKSHPRASILKSGRVVFNIKANDYRLIAIVQYANSILMIRFFGSHEEYDRVDA